MESKLIYFKAIVEESSVSKAAVKMNLSQPYMSKILREVERQYGTTLINRNYNPLSPTPAGKRLMQYIEDLETLENQLIKDLAALSRKGRKELVIAVPPMRGRTLIPRITKELKSKLGINPQFVESYLGNAMQMLKDGEVNMGVFLKSMCVDEQIAYQDVYSEPFILVLPPEHPLGIPEALGDYQNPPAFNCQDFGELSKMTFITYQKDMRLSEIVDRFRSTHHINNSPEIRLRSASTFLEMVLEGQGVTIVPMYQVAKYENRDKLYYFSLSESYMMNNYVLAWNRYNLEEKLANLVTKIVRDAWVF